MKWVPNVLRQNFQRKLIAFSISLDSEEQAVITSSAAGTGVAAEQNHCKLHILLTY